MTKRPVHHRSWLRKAGRLAPFSFVVSLIFYLKKHSTQYTSYLFLLSCFLSCHCHALPANNKGFPFPPKANANTAVPPSKTLAPIIAKLDEHIQDLIKRKQIPGCAVAIVQNNQIVFMQSYGFKTLGKPEKIDSDTVFQLGSVSKPISATLASILENKGYFKMDDPIDQYLPHFYLNSKSPPDALKIKHILSHSTGVARGGFNNLIESYVTYDHLLKNLQQKRVRNAPGKKYDYNNAMFGLISAVTKATTHLSFKDALRVNLLQPLNMTRTSATFEGLISNPNRATPHTKSRRGGLIPCPTYSTGYYTVAPAGGINSSIRDMAIFLKAQMGGYPKVVNRQVLVKIQTPQITTNNVLNGFSGGRIIQNPRYGLGWRIVDFANKKLVFHGGWVKGFTNFIAFMPEQELGIVVLHNGDDKFSTKTAVKFFAAYLNIPQNDLVPRQITKKQKGLKKRRKIKTA